jgi:hypothetical protein|tara:strand:- start:323 stop:580 length:258 start_codon:yes stop_codon:yes gene_type:complete
MSTNRGPGSVLNLTNATVIVPDHGDFCGSLGMWMSEWTELSDQTDEISDDSFGTLAWTEHVEAKAELADQIGQFLVANLKGGLPN